jgi:RNA polymerase sigma-70 factor (ECF subfamily)
MALSMEDSQSHNSSTRKTRLTNPTCLADHLVENHYAYLYRLAASILDDPDDADDAVQETILRALANSQNIPAGQEQRRWLATVAVNHCRDRLRRRKARQTLNGILQSLHLVTEVETSVEELYDNNQDHSEIWEAIQSLDEKHRLPVLLRYVNGMSTNEIALTLKISEGTVYSRLHYAIGKLRKQLGPAFEGGL